MHTLRSPQTYRYVYIPRLIFFPFPMAKSIALLTLAALLTVSTSALAQRPEPTFSLPSKAPTLEPPSPLKPGNFTISPEASTPAGKPKPQGPFSLSDRLNELRTANTGVRRTIISELSDPSREIMPALLSAFKTESDPLVKSALATVLANRWEEATPAIDDLVTMLADKRRALVPFAHESPLSIPSAILPEILGSPIKRYPSMSPGNPTHILRIDAIEALGNIGLPAREKATQSLTTLLQDENPLVRVNAVWALLEIGADVPVLETWMSVLQSRDSEARQAAARLGRGNDSLLRKAFGSEATPKTIKQLVSLLGDSEDEVRAAVRSSLELFGKEAIPELTSALESPNPRLRINAAQLLGNFGPSASQAAPALIKRLSDRGEYNPPPQPLGSLIFTLAPFSRSANQTKPTQDDRFVRTNAALALGSIGSTEAIPALQLGLKDPHPKMRLASAWALTQLNRPEIATPVLGALVNDSDFDIHNDSIRILKTLGTQGTQYIIPALLKQFDGANPEYREQLVLNFDLGAMALPGVSRLRQALEGPDLTARGYAVTVLANIYEDLARQNVRGELSKPDRQLATQELTRILKIVTKPDAKFNQPPIDRLRLVQTKL
jgi:HEAT repeat protein